MTEVDPAVRQILRKAALLNAAQHDGKAQEKSVLAKLLGERADLRPMAKDLKELVGGIVAEVNALTTEQQAGALEALGLPRDGKVASAGPREASLPDLPPPPFGTQIVMRLAPGPSGPLHLGHARMCILNDEFTRRYKGKLILRMEDTDPDHIDPEAYGMIPEDVKWLGVETHETIVQSDRFPVYYDIAKQMLEKNLAYCCTCKADFWRERKEAGHSCPHRMHGPTSHLEIWDGMLAGRYKQEEAVLVIKTDLKDPNPALRDWVALRIVDKPHPRTNDRYRVYPLMNFGVACDDHLLGLTHVLRGKDHINNTERQKWVFKAFDWPLPYYYHYGRISIEGAELSTSKMGQGIKDGIYSGWDDPRLGTLRAMARRGIRPEAIRKYWVETGMKEVDIQLSWDTLFAYNRDIIDPIANRYAYVWDTTRVQLEEGAGGLVSRSPLHPADETRGFRITKLEADGPTVDVIITKDDAATLQPGNRFRLKDLGNFEWIGRTGKPSDSLRAKYIGNDRAILKEGVPIFHWTIPLSRGSAPMLVLMPDGTSKSGLAEPAITGEKGDIVQFERFGFVALARNERGRFEATYAHR